MTKVLHFFLSVLMAVGAWAPNRSWDITALILPEITWKRLRLNENVLKSLSSCAWECPRFLPEVPDFAFNGLFRLESAWSWFCLVPGKSKNQETCSTGALRRCPPNTCLSLEEVVNSSRLSLPHWQTFVLFCQDHYTLTHSTAVCDSIAAIPPIAWSHPPPPYAAILRDIHAIGTIWGGIARWLAISEDIDATGIAISYSAVGGGSQWWVTSRVFWGPALKLSQIRAD